MSLNLGIAVAVSLVLLPLVFLLRRDKETYSLDHAILNTQPPKTLWLNMGYWKDTDSFPEACEALFRHLIKSLDLSDKDILDIGSGCGDSTSLLAEMKPRSLKGVTSERSQYTISRERFPEVDFVHADAITYVSSLEEGTVDCIIGLDCVYHFSLRYEFLKQSSRLVRPGGHLALTDLILGPNTTFSQRLLLRLICALTSSPFANFKPQKEYLQDYKEAGFKDIEMEDISEVVFLGLAGFLGRHRRLMKGLGIGGRWGGYLAFKKVLEWWSTGVVRFVVITAKK